MLSLQILAHILSFDVGMECALIPCSGVMGSIIVKMEVTRRNVVSADFCWVTPYVYF